MFVFYVVCHGHAIASPNPGTFAENSARLLRLRGFRGWLTLECDLATPRPFGRLRMNMSAIACLRSAADDSTEGDQCTGHDPKPQNIRLLPTAVGRRSRRGMRGSLSAVRTDPSSGFATFSPLRRGEGESIFFCVVCHGHPITFANPGTFAGSSPTLALARGSSSP